MKRNENSNRRVSEQGTLRAECNCSLRWMFLVSWSMLHPSRETRKLMFLICSDSRARLDSSCTPPFVRTGFGCMSRHRRHMVCFFSGRVEEGLIEQPFPHRSADVLGGVWRNVLCWRAFMAPRTPIDKITVEKLAVEFPPGKQVYAQEVLNVRS